MTEDFDDVGKIIREMRKLNRITICVGALKPVGGASEAHMEMIAMANEFGVPHIRPRNGKWLTIPTKLAGAMGAREIDGLFKPRGKNFLAKKNGSGGFDIYFWLKKEVTVPKRSFLGDTFTEKIGTSWLDKATVEISRVSVGEIRARECMDSIGRLMARDVQARIATMSTPPNAPATIERKGKDNPLIDTGALYRSINWTEDAYE